MDKQTFVVFLILVFGAVFVLTQSLIVPAFGTGRRESKRLKLRLGEMANDILPEKQISLLRDRYQKLSPLENFLESLPGMGRLEILIERSGREFPAYRLCFVCFGLAIVGGLAAWWSTRNIPATLVAAAILGWLPIFKLKIDIAKRFAKFEEQLPEALDVMTRGLRAGYPFIETMRLVATEMEAPIAKEFGTAFDEINFGADMRWSLRNLVCRLPSLSLMAVVTTVLVQRETGGNLAETLQNISGVIRARYRFHRKVRTLTAEGRVSAWVMVLVPFVLFGMLALINPDYALTLAHHPLGRKLVLAGLALLVLGNLWIRKLISIEI